MKKFLLVTIFTISLFAWGGNHHNHQCKGNMETILNNYPIQSLSNSEKQALNYMAEEEKLARDVYITLYNKWGLRVFGNIQKAEQQHINMVKMLAERYNIKMNSLSIGLFNDKKVQKLYNKLVRIGSISRIDALKVGATIEDLDIYDLEKYMAEADNQDILFIFKNLTKGSRNHMRAFMRNIQRFGGDYNSKYISQLEFNKIINSNIEKGIIR